MVTVAEPMSRARQPTIPFIECPVDSAIHKREFVAELVNPGSRTRILTRISTRALISSIGNGLALKSKPLDWKTSNWSSVYSSTP
jgi:hypothetical protein